MRASSCGTLCVGLPPTSTTTSRARIPACSAPAALHAADQDAIRGRQSEILRHIRRQRLRLDAEPTRVTSPSRMICSNTVRAAKRNREGDAIAAAGLREDYAVDADQLPAVSMSAPPELPGLIAASVWMKSSKRSRPVISSERADNARGHRIAEAERIADRQHDVAYLQVFRVAERDRRQVGSVCLEHGDVRSAAADDGSARRAWASGRHRLTGWLCDNQRPRHQAPTTSSSF